MLVIGLGEVVSGQWFGVVEILVFFIAVKRCMFTPGSSAFLPLNFFFLLIMIFCTDDTDSTSELPSGSWFLWKIIS